MALIPGHGVALVCLRGKSQMQSMAGHVPCSRSSRLPGVRSWTCLAMPPCGKGRLYCRYICLQHAKQDDRAVPRGV